MLNWIHYDINTNADAEAMRRNFHATVHTATAFDTETTGLHHILDRPFLFQFGWYDEDSKQGWTYAVDLQRTPLLATKVITVWNALVKSAYIYLGHHVNFDLHMCENIGLPYTGTNVSDTMNWIRLGMDAIPQRKGGAPLKLKDFAKQYVSIAAKDMDSKIQLLRTKQASVYNSALRKKLGWTQKKIDAFFNDTINDADDLPPDVRELYYAWKADLPLYLQHEVTGKVESDMIRYDMIDRDIVRHYAHLDIVWTLETYRILLPAVTLRGNLPAIAIENENLRAVYKMERTGFLADKQYLEESRVRTKAYIRTRREDLYSLAGQVLTLNQHAVIKDILQNRYGIQVASTGADELDLLVSDLKHKGGNEEAVEFIETLQELRTLEKWYATYLMRFIKDLRTTDRLYTSINTAGAASGRVTSDFQQFPKKAIKTKDGAELFYPRKIVLVDRAQGFKGIVYLDYSQIELRFQAMYTILVGHADLNLCRAYMPYKCYTWDGNKAQQFRIPFDYKTPWCIKEAYSRTWYREEDDTVWVPTDVHGATTKAAFGITEDDEQYHDLRYVGKRVNFARLSQLYMVQCA